MQPDVDKELKTNSLLLYKNHPARLLRIGERVEIELQGGETARVRPKDFTVLHPGPLSSLSELRTPRGEVQAGWEILAGEHTHLAELAELIYGAFTPITAWAAWQQVVEGVYFEGTPEDIRARSVDEVARRQQERSQAEANQRAWQAFLGRVKQKTVAPEDAAYLRDVENLALGRSQRSNVLRDLGRSETAENAHALLLELGVWNEQVNPYPTRLGAPVSQPDLPVPRVPAEERLDLTHLATFAIDDAGTDTPDDAISFNEGWLWVHVADAAALAPPDSPLDLEARSRGESLHLPEGTIHLLPWDVTQQVGLGLTEVTPALSFGMQINTEGQVTQFRVTPSLVKVTRLTYEEAELWMDREPFVNLERITQAVRERRRTAGAVMLDFPEAKLSVVEGQVQIYPLPTLRSRAIVEEAMILASTQTAQFAQEKGLRLPFSQQEAIDTADRPQTLSGMFALRRLLRRSRYQTTPGPHSGLGVAAYAQVTSPLRRYLDLVSHQQLRAYLTGTSPLDDAALLERIGATEAVTGIVRQAESLSEKHWTMVYLLQHPGWQGQGILVEQRGNTGIVLIPSLALETRVQLRGSLALDQPLMLALSSVDLPQRDARFRVVY